tara:strand:+ start:662 stop:1060 length:399 start_codon:yes stop_codon:yes gene_type:complete
MINMTRFDFLKNISLPFIQNKNAMYCLFTQLIAVIIFAFLYWCAEQLMIKYNTEYSELINQKHTAETKETLMFNSFIYYLWFSFITQTTVGYAGVISPYGVPFDWISDHNIYIKYINIVQLISIFYIIAVFT